MDNYNVKKRLYNISRGKDKIKCWYNEIWKKNYHECIIITPRFLNNIKVNCVNKLIFFDK